MTQEDLEELLKLPAEERLEMAQALWDSVDPEEQARLLSLPDRQRRVLRDRLANPDDEHPRDEVKEKLWPKGTSRFPAFEVPADTRLISAARVQKAMDEDEPA